ncbi:hypothetical protein THAOC_34172 [Thalassiosira oceanica]|uniref:N-acetyltransferase domain-containing protein n=1 Tax=Thalassiosira oceanica TaxID=159749 RepID=K0RKB5_THAOC|nr:hypothetical protein THAOC_34172 [Thalassiosira oceanica]|eukprot:EJK47132.1 hypothetical protein THAOC_34172 [Thalassiosira oceanica]
MMRLINHGSDQKSCCSFSRPSRHIFCPDCHDDDYGCLSPIIRRLVGPSDALPFLSSFSKLSEGTEMAGYKDPQWKFLLAGSDTEPHALLSSDGLLDGAVVKVNLDDSNFGLGMVLVDPKHRGKGYAKALIRSAMETKPGKDQRCVLAICTALGQPVYRKLGFQDSGTITSMSSTASDVLNSNPPRRPVDLSVMPGKECSQEQLDTLARLDGNATGRNRKGRIELLVKASYAEEDGSRSTVAFVGNKSAAVARQDCVGGPLIVGPVVGEEEDVPAMVWALVRKHFEGNEECAKDVIVQMMVVNHSSLVSMLEVEGMKLGGSLPSMTSDGESVYNKGDGSYWAMMHPSLG